MDQGGVERPRQFFDQISGGHKPNGILVMRGPGIAPGKSLEGAELLDMAPTILYFMGQPVPVIMDGQVLAQALQPGFLATHPVVYADQPDPPDLPMSITAGGNTVHAPLWSAPAGPDNAYSEDETREVEERLRGLGYLA
jgi:hypothetical protein